MRLDYFDKPYIMGPIEVLLDSISDEIVAGDKIVIGYTGQKSKLKNNNRGGGMMGGPGGGPR